MAGTGVTLYATDAAGNKIAFASGIDWREDVYMPAQVNDNVAQIMADIRALVNSIGTGFVEVGDTNGAYTAYYNAANQFRIEGADVTGYYYLGRRIYVQQPSGNLIGTVTAVAYTAPNTHVTVAWDSGSLVSEAITAVLIGIGSGYGGAAPAGSPPVYTQCRMVFSDAVTIGIQRFDGSLLTIDDTPRTIPAAGVYMSNSGLTANSTQYIYAYMDGSTMKLAASTSAPVTDSRNGLKVHSSAASWTHVGLVRVNNSGTFEDSTLLRFVRSYFNRRPIWVEHSFVGSTGSATMTVLSTLQWVSYGDDLVSLTWSGFCQNNATAWGASLAEVWVDGSQSGLQCLANSGVTNATLPFCLHRPGAWDGYHYAQAMGSTPTASSTSQWTGLFSVAVEGNI